MALQSDLCRACRITTAQLNRALARQWLGYWPKILRDEQTVLSRRQIPLELRLLLEQHGSAAWITDGKRVWNWNKFPSPESLYPSDLEVFLMGRRTVSWVTQLTPEFEDVFEGGAAC